LHVSNVTGFHHSFPRLHHGNGKFTTFRVPPHCARTRNPGALTKERWLLQASARRSVGHHSKTEACQAAATARLPLCFHHALCRSSVPLKGAINHSMTPHSHKQQTPWSVFQDGQQMTLPQQALTFLPTPDQDALSNQAPLKRIEQLLAPRAPIADRQSRRNERKPRWMHRPCSSQPCQAPLGLELNIPPRK